MERARRRIEQLRLQGTLSRWAAKWDLQAIDYLERHPDRTFPRDLADWIREIGLFFWIGDPGPYRMLRLLVLEGAMEESQRDRALRGCMVVCGILLALVEYVSLGAMAWVTRFSGSRAPSWAHLAELANLAVLLTAGGCVMGVVLYFVLRSELRKLQASIQRLD